MALSAVQQVLVSAVLVLCVFLVMPRMFGGGGGGRPGRSPRGGRAGPGHYDPRQHGRGSPQAVYQVHRNPGNSDSNTYQSIQQMRNAMEKEIKSERTRGSGRELAFTLMPLYALGVGMFAAYKLLKMKSREESHSKKEKSTEEKAKETEHQLLELEQHLAQTEKMLNSLLTQLDPLSNCVNALACEQKDEIMTQLQSIRRLMKESGLDKSENKMKGAQDIELECQSHSVSIKQAFGTSVPKQSLSTGLTLGEGFLNGDLYDYLGHICNEKLEDLIQSFAEHSQEKEMDNREHGCSEDLLEDIDNDYKIEEHELHSECEIHQLEPDVVEDEEMISKDAIESEEMGLRRRNRYEWNLHM